MFLKQIDLDVLQCEHLRRDGSEDDAVVVLNVMRFSTGSRSRKTSDFHPDRESILFYAIRLTCVHTI